MLGILGNNNQLKLNVKVNISTAELTCEKRLSVSQMV